MKDSIGKRVATESPVVVIKRSFRSKFISLLGFWPWAALFIMDILGIDTVSSMIDGDNKILCAAVAVVDLIIFLIVAYVRSRMITYVYTDTLVYIPEKNPRENTRARSFVGVYQANILPPSGFFIVVWIKKIRRLLRGYRDIFITCPGSQADGTIILRGIRDFNNVIEKLNTIRVSESTNIAYTKPTQSSRTDY